MKKYAILTSVLALAACGGGSGGGGVVAPARPAIGDITGMKTAVTNKTQVVAYVESKLGDLNDYGIDTTQQKTRARAPRPNKSPDEKYDLATKLIEKAKNTLNGLASITDENKNDVIEALKLADQNISGDPSIDNIKDNLNNIKETIEGIISNASQRIDDVQFNIVSATDDGDPDRGTLTLTTDGKNITDVKLVYDDEPVDKFALTSLGGNKFRFVITGDEGVEIAEGKIAMLGRNHKLQYADFGYIEQTTIEDGKPETTREFLTGGYDVMHIDAEKLSGTMEFSGTAVAQMWNDATAEYKQMQDNHATLTFDNGTETLNMAFKDWYAVKITNNSITFTGEPTKKQFAFENSDNPNNSKVLLLTNYYGDGAAEEVTANFGYVEGRYNSDNDTTLKAFTGAFGGKRKN